MIIIDVHKTFDVRAAPSKMELSGGTFCLSLCLCRLALDINSANFCLVLKAKTKI